MSKSHIAPFPQYINVQGLMVLIRIGTTSLYASTVIESRLFQALCQVQADRTFDSFRITDFNGVRATKFEEDRRIRSGLKPWLACVEGLLEVK